MSESSLQPRRHPRFALIPCLAVAAAVASAPSPRLEARQGGHLFVTIPALDLDGGSASLFTGWSRWCSTHCYLVANAHLPHGARVVGIEIDACRDTFEDEIPEFGLLRKGPHEEVDQGTGAKFGIVFSGFYNVVGCAYRRVAPGQPIEVDLFNGEYLVFVEIGEFLCGLPGGPPCPDEGSRVQALRVYYEPVAEGVVSPSKRTGVVLFDWPAGEPGHAGEGGEP